MKDQGRGFGVINKMSENEHERRLERVETKIDRLSEALVSMARIEERVTTVLKQTDRFMDRLDKMEERLEIVELQSNLNKKAVSNTERVGWVVLTAAVSTAFFLLR
jgi:DNA integrity scanning protein DisA with diadenylate cyclase activity